MRSKRCGTLAVLKTPSALGGLARQWRRLFWTVVASAATGAVISRASAAATAWPAVAARRTAAIVAVVIAEGALPVALRGRRTRTRTPGEAFAACVRRLPNGEVWGLSRSADLPFVARQLGADQAPMRRTFFNGPLIVQTVGLGI